MKKKYHYILGVAVHSALSKEAGKFFLKYFLKYTEKDVKAVNKAIEMSKNEMWKATTEEALKAYNKSGLISSLHGLLLSSSVNNATLHHFVTENEVEEEVFEIIVSLTNSSKYCKELLNKSRIRKRY